MADLVKLLFIILVVYATFGDVNGQCSPNCDGVTSFCANDTEVTPYCACVYGKVYPGGFNDTTATNCIDPLPTTEPLELEIQIQELMPRYMDSNKKKTIEVIETIMILWVVGWCVAVMGLFFMIRHFRCDRIIQMQEEICLIIICILIAGLAEEPQVGEGMCKFTSILLQYFILALMTFFCLEALHSFSLVTYMIEKDGFFRVIINLAIGYLTPLLPLIISFGALYKDYGTIGYHCWCNMDTDQAWAFLAPIILLGFLCTIIAEAQGQGAYKELPETDRAEVSQGSLMLIMPCSLLTYIFGLLAVHFQSLTFYILFIIFSFFLGPLVFFFHCIGNERIRNMLKKLCPCLPCLQDKPPPRPMTATGLENESFEPEQEPVEEPVEEKQEKPSKEKLKEDTDWRNLHSWVTDGKMENLKHGENILFND